jgi:hypothetical protein
LHIRNDSTTYIVATLFLVIFICLLRYEVLKPVPLNIGSKK